MPYIDKAHRSMIDRSLEEFTGKLKELVRSGSVADEKLDGVLNYVITKLLKQIYAPVSYYKINRIMGLLECIKQEYYRAVAAPYEDQKRMEHGDVC